jgi:catechol 2,3-dioxygenase-like lactoylglutathione lyase family enzyme
MPAFHGVDHAVLTVTDLDRSEEFYWGVLGFLPVMDFGHGRILMDRKTGFSLGIVRPEGAHGGAFTELTTGLDHLGLAAESRDELVEWEAVFRAKGVKFTPIRDMELAHHLNFRDPDDIALELSAPNDVYRAALEALRSDISDSEVWDAAGQFFPAEMVARRDR